MNTTAIHPNVRMLRTLYANLARIGEFVTDDMILHKADRAFFRDAMAGRVVGREAAVAHERELIALTGNTLVMDVEHITANDHFGAVFGILRAHRDGAKLAVPFCGVWRFRDGRITEHWENAYDVVTVQAFLCGNEISSAFVHNED
ncbi:nuclear transport factor 2 family protein [Polyangium jinanense]|uniref:Nuclear transport factor 2 family protein n=1 Tax=Polyangium jinanense TaxID=2829994 RepID=A0A9X4AT81_9BACT|nr:nuclear transport factor 2 family protein [Polyangium jinanense]MDC3959114.1 nuclear transport factor 2 family protein [Polyangium jinanense]MDC3983963.1 nuclear transport factor 2 family protein [Polyangium jinanense]